MRVHEMKSEHQTDSCFSVTNCTFSAAYLCAIVPMFRCKMEHIMCATYTTFQNVKWEMLWWSVQIKIDDMIER